MRQLLIKFYYAFCNSWKGIQAAWRTEWAFRTELVIFMLALPFVFIFGRSTVEYAPMISSLVILPMLELINSAIEATVDRIGTEYHELSARAKDMASAALVFAGINVLVIWGLIFIRWLYNII